MTLFKLCSALCAKWFTEWHYKSEIWHSTNIILSQFQTSTELFFLWCENPATFY